MELHRAGMADRAGEVRRMKVTVEKKPAEKLLHTLEMPPSLGGLNAAKPAEEVRRADTRREERPSGAPRNPCRRAMAHRQVMDKHGARKENRRAGAFQHDGMPSV